MVRARKNGLIVKEIDGELVMYDEVNDKAHQLNQTASVVWKHCDGESTVSQIARKLGAETDLAADDEIVQLAIAELRDAGLLEAGAPSFAISRRSLIRRLGLAAGTALLLPAVTSIVAPTPAMALSGTGTGAPGTFAPTP